MKSTELKKSPYAPGANGSGTSDPVRLATITMRAVDEIGEGAAAEIEKTAAAIEAGAKEKADKLRQLAEAVRAQSRIAAEHVADFCERSTTVFETISGLEAKIAGRGTEGGDDGEPVPAFLGKGPHAGEAANGAGPH